MSKRWLSSIVVIAPALVLVPGASATRGAEFQMGTYSSTFRGDAVTLTFKKDGKFILIDKDSKLLVEGKYKLTKDQIEFNDERGRIAAKGMPGKYRWKLGGKKLTFTKVEDSSEGRVKGLTTNPWTLEE